MFSVLVRLLSFIRSREFQLRFNLFPLLYLFTDWGCFPSIAPVVPVVPVFLTVFIERTRDGQSDIEARQDIYIDIGGLRASGLNH